MWPFTKKNQKNKKKRKYEGASTGRRTSGWLTPAGDANSSIKRDLPWLRERSRDLRRNNGYAKKAIEVGTNNVVGKGIKTQINNESAKSLWKEWCETTACDYDGVNDLYGLQRLIMDSVQESGEVLVRKRYVNDKKFPIQYQVLECDFLDSGKLDGFVANSKNYIIQGVEFTPDGKLYGYHLYDHHPGSSSAGFSVLNTNFVPASEICHIFRRERPGQVRGVPWLSPVMIKLKDLDDFEDAQIYRAKIASLFVAFVKDISDSVDCEDESDLGEKMLPGMIEHLPPGKDVEFANPPSFDLFDGYIKTGLKGISAGYGITYESLSNDLSDVNFSSGRMGWIEMGRNIDSWRKNIMINQFMMKVQRDFIELMLLNGMNARSLTFEHIPPRREMIDPEKEIKAMKAEVRAGFNSRTAVVQSLGRDPDLVLKQQSDDNKKADKEGLVFDSDPRHTNVAGTSQVEKTQEDNSQGESE